MSFFPTLATWLSGVIHSGAKVAQGRTGILRVNQFGRSGVKFVDVTMRFIEQNPQKASQFAELARRGHKITWIVVPMENGRMTYTNAGVIDGKYFDDMHVGVQEVLQKESNHA